MLNAASNVLANAGEAAHSAALEERLLRTSAIIKAATETRDSDGNPTQASMLEAMMYLFQHLDESMGELQHTMYETSAVAAAGVMKQDADELARANEDAELAEIQSNLNNTINSRMLK